MGNYKKPVITVDAGMAEGIYASSGTQQSAVIVGTLTVVNDWGNSGQATFSLDLSNCNLSQLTVVLTFNMDIINAWGGGASVSVNGSTATLNWYSAPTSAEITVQANGNIKELQCTGSSYSNK